MVVGASRGIGLSIAIDLAAKGFDLCLMARSVSGLEAARQACVKANPDVHTLQIPIDITDSKAAGSTLESAVHQMGDRIHVLVYASGIFEASHSVFAHGAYQQTFAVNVEGCVRTVAVCLPVMMRTGEIEQKSTDPSKLMPSIILLSSVAAKDSYPIPSHGIYMASKAALHNYAHVLFNEVRSHGVKVSLICPGLVATDMATDIMSSFGSKNDTSEVAGAKAKKAETAERMIRGALQADDIARAACEAVFSQPTVNWGEVVVEPNAQFSRVMDAFVAKPTEFPQCKYPITAPTKDIALVTGASRGIGRAISLSLARQGYDLALVARGRAELESLKDECKALGVRCNVYPLDVRDIDALETAVHHAVRDLGSLVRDSQRRGQPQEISLVGGTRCVGPVYRHQSPVRDARHACGAAVHRANPD